MAVNIKTTNMQLPEALRNYVEDKLSNLERHLPNAPTNIDVELDHQTRHNSGPIFRCEIMYAFPREKHILRAESTETDMYAAIDTCMPKIKEQLDKEWDKRDTLARRGGRALKRLLRR